MFDFRAVNTIHIGEVLEEIYGSTMPKAIPGGRPVYWFDSPEYQADDWDAQCAKTRAWCADCKAHYYARPKEDFFTREACQEALNAGKFLVVLDNLS